MSGYGQSKAHLYDIEDVAPVSPSSKQKKPASLKKISASLKNVVEHIGDPSESSNRGGDDGEKPYAHHRKYNERTTKQEKLADAEQERKAKKRMYMIWGGVIGLVLLIIVAVLLGVLLPNNSDDDDDNKPTQSPTYHPNAIMYGDIVYIQNLGFARRWLTGGHGIEMEEVYTQDVYNNNNANDEIIGDLTKLRWKIDNPIVDGTCVKYGDKVHLKLMIVDDNNANESELWLSGGRGEGLQFTYTRDPTTVISEQSLLDDGTYEWIVRTTLGNGSRTKGGLNFGDCVIYQDEDIDDNSPINAVYFQSNKLDSRWLVGSRGLFNDGVQSFDYNLDTGDFGASIQPNYQWKILKELGSGEL